LGVRGDITQKKPPDPPPKKMRKGVGKTLKTGEKKLIFPIFRPLKKNSGKRPVRVLPVRRKRGR